VSLAVELPDDFLDEILVRLQGRLQERSRWVDIDGLARYYEVDVERIRDLRARGLPARKLPDPKTGKLSKRLWFNVDETDAWISREGVRV
jgi:hypothetical protein